MVAKKSALSEEGALGLLRFPRPGWIASRTSELHTYDAAETIEDSLDCTDHTELCTRKLVEQRPLEVVHLPCCYSRYSCGKNTTST